MGEVSRRIVYLSVVGVYKEVLKVEARGALTKYNMSSAITGALNVIDGGEKQEFCKGCNRGTSAKKVMKKIFLWGKL